LNIKFALVRNVAYCAMPAYQKKSINILQNYHVY